jgi:hypothetical protein
MDTSTGWVTLLTRVSASAVQGQVAGADPADRQGEMRVAAAVVFGPLTAPDP